MQYLNPQVLEKLNTEGVTLNTTELSSYPLICEQAQRETREFKTKKDPLNGRRFSVWHAPRMQLAPYPQMSHWLILPGLKTWKSKGEDIVTKKAINLISGEQMFVKIRRPTNILQRNHIEYSRHEATNHERVKSSAYHYSLYSEGHGVKAYLFQRHRGDDSLQEMLDDTSNPAEKILNLLFASGQALKKLHAKGYLHTDFKPRNIVFNKTTQMLALVDLEFMISLAEGAAGIRQLAGTEAYIHPDWFRENRQNFHRGLTVKYSPANDLYAYLVTADACLGAAYCRASPQFRKLILPAWMQIRHWKAVSFSQLPDLDSVINFLKQRLIPQNENIIQVQPEEEYKTARSMRL